MRHFLRVTAFPTIAWDDLEYSASRDSRVLGAQVRKNENLYKESKQISDFRDSL